MKILKCFEIYLKSKMMCHQQLNNIMTKIEEISSFYSNLSVAVNYIFFLRKKHLYNCKQIYSIKFDDLVSLPKYCDTKKNIDCTLFELDTYIFEIEKQDIIDSKLIRILINKSDFDKCCMTIGYYSDSILLKNCTSEIDLFDTCNKKFFNVNELIQKIEYLKSKIEQTKEFMIRLVKETEIIDSKTTYYVSKILKTLKFLEKDVELANNINKFTNKFVQKNNLLFSNYE